MSPEHPCYPHKATCDWCRVCIRGDCCDHDEQDKPVEKLVDAVASRRMGVPA